MSKSFGAASLASPRVWAAVAILAATGLATGAVAKEAKDKDAVKVKKEIKVKTDGGYLGVYMQELNDDVREGLDVGANTRGVLISGVEDGSPAERAGIEEGDIIVKFAGKSVATPDELRDAVQGVEPGDEAKVEVLHEGKSATLTVTVGERGESTWFAFQTPEVGMHHGRGALAFFGGPRLGIHAHEIDDDGLGAYFGVKSGDGVLVLGVDENSVAAKAGVEPGDVIREVGEEKIADVSDLRQATREFDEGDEFTITVLRRGKTSSLKATMDESASQAAYLPRNMRWHGWDGTPAPRVRAYDRQRIERDIREELEDLREELQEMKEQLDRKDG
jgi:serine protease Do